MESPVAWPRAHHRPANRSVVGDFNQEEQEDLISFDEPSPPPYSETAPVHTASLSTASRMTTQRMQTRDWPLAFQYRPPNPALFSGFGDDDDGEPEVSQAHRRVSASSRSSLSPHQMESNTPPPPRRGYRNVSASLLGGFNDDDNDDDDTTLKLSPGRRRAGAEQQNGSKPTTANPYELLIESRQNAMTVSYLQSQETQIHAQADTPAYPTDEYG